AGLMEGLMWRAYDKFGFLKYAFVQVVVAEHPFMVIRMAGGVFFLAGAVLMAYNFWKTVHSETTELPLTEAVPAGALAAGE
ncbi:MAG: cytochrome oxidase, partial [Rhodospirillales bacterium]|nr:cytochrome oxidase [Rhodospirillales bacterium]